MVSKTDKFGVCQGEGDVQQHNFVPNTSRSCVALKKGERVKVAHTTLLQGV